MPLIKMKQIDGGEKLQKDIDNLINNIGISKEDLFSAMLSWLLEDAPQDFSPQIKPGTRLATLIDSYANYQKK